MKKSSRQIIKEAFRLIAFKRESALRKAIFLLGEAVIAFVIAFSEDSVGIVKEISGYIGQIQVGLIGVVFTGYALFQALISDDLLLYLLDSKEDDRSKLEESNDYFISLVTLQIFLLIIDVVIYLFMCAVPENWCLTDFNGLNVFISMLLLTIVLYINIESIYELKSFVFNVFQLFNAHAASSVISRFNKHSDDK